MLLLVFVPIRLAGPQRAANVLTLVRSANDSADDVRRYLSCAHGVLPKNVVLSKDETLAQLEPLWRGRFGTAAGGGDASGGAAAEVVSTPRIVRTTSLRAHQWPGVAGQ